MQGKILDFSVQTNSGIISGDDQQRYSFVGSEWKEQQLPKRGMSVDFDVNTDGDATAIYAALASPNTSTIIQQFQEKEESQYSAFDWFLKCMKYYVNFNGRARRKEFWFFALFYLLGAFITMFFRLSLRCRDSVLYVVHLSYGSTSSRRCRSSFT